MLFLHRSGNKIEMIEHHTKPSTAPVPSSSSSSTYSSAAVVPFPYFWHSPRAYSPSPLLRVSVFQGSAVPLDVESNLLSMRSAMQRARSAAQLILFPSPADHRVFRERRHTDLLSQRMKGYCGGCKDGERRCRLLSALDTQRGTRPHSHHQQMQFPLPPPPHPAAAMQLCTTRRFSPAKRVKPC